MTPSLLIYIALMLIIMGIAVVLNWKYQWINKEWTEENGELFAFIIVMFAFWPFGIIILIGGLLLYAAHKYLIPK